MGTVNQPPPPPVTPPVPAPADRPAQGPSTTPRTLSLSCSSCGGGLVFEAREHALACPQCGRTEPFERETTRPPERDLAAGLAQADPAAGPGRATPAGQGALDQELVCPNCHGRVGFVGALTATRCPFCAAPVQRSDIAAAPDRLPVDGIVPFGVNLDRAREEVERWIAKRRFAPNGFKRYSEAGSFAGVYLPFFTFDADTVNHYDGERGTSYTVTVGSGKNRRTETRIRWKNVSGRVEKRFYDVPIGAQISLERDRLRDLEPWPTTDAVPFRPEYLAGHLARSYERDLPDCRGEAGERMAEGIEAAVKRAIGGNHQRIHRIETTWSDETYRHLLLPIFLLVVTFRSKPYRVFVNGATGEVQGQRPYSWIKILLAGLAGVVAAAVIGYAMWVMSEDDRAAQESETIAIARGLIEPRTISDGSAAVGGGADDGPGTAAAEPAADATVEADPDACREATIAYRDSAVDTYFPDVPECAGLEPGTVREIGRAVFLDEQVELTADAADAAASKGKRARCEAAFMASAAEFVAKVEPPRGLGSTCNGLSEQVLAAIEDDVVEETKARERRALADAPQ